MKGFSYVDRNEWFEVSGPEVRATRRTTKVTEEGETRKDDCPNKPSLNSFAVRSVDTWNDLSEIVQKSETVNGFTTRYDSWKKSQSAEDNNNNP